MRNVSSLFRNMWGLNSRGSFRLYVNCIRLEQRLEIKYSYNQNLCKILLELCFPSIYIPCFSLKIEILLYIFLFLLPSYNIAQTFSC